MFPSKAEGGHPSAYVWRFPFSPLLTLTIPFCAIVRLNAYPKCSILQYLLPVTMVRLGRITPPQYLLLRCCPGFYCDWGREYTQVAGLQGSIATPWLCMEIGDRIPTEDP